ncbi:MAG TPA: mandelate racemase/muconate lactonizing enzyme family protein [Geminicoccaceae bacterium]|nr:mandelate racemase/muconate lactonizing enzyme family protein [Geminicoccaceae bacterium]
MRIAEVEVVNLVFHYPKGGGFRYAGGACTGRVTSLVRVHTECGAEGIGSVYSHPDLVRIVVEGQLRPFLLGADPLDTEALWRRMYELTRWYGRKGAALSALGGVDIALWDLKGKAAGKPVSALLGAERASVPAYASGLLWHDDVAELEREAARHRGRGFRRVKMRLGRDESYDVVALDAVLRGVGRDGGVMVDGSHRYTIEGAVTLARVLAERGVVWFEEPFAPEDIDAYVALRGRGVGVKLAAGENEFGLQGFRELLRAGAVDIAQPDACRTGGITEQLRVARMAAEHGVRIAPHTWSDAVALIANAHVVASLPHAITVEVDQTGNPFIDGMTREPLRIGDGLLALPEGPGLGVEVDWDRMAGYVLPAGEPVPPGNYSDMVFAAGGGDDRPA